MISFFFPTKNNNSNIKHKKGLLRITYTRNQKWVCIVLVCLTGQ